ncbi:L-serine ammonia-lyase [Rhabdaerophilum sp.]|uniref:L-serine ammonia-lyase n=1 Tax=Rhabdaerophilum sp. TaxID=2717341 RepID=UPI0038D47D32
MIGIFDLFKIGIGPSSSHTVGPMKAASSFVAALEAGGFTPGVVRVVTTLYGSLAWTGKGHGTAKAVILGLAGLHPSTIDPEAAEEIAGTVATARRLRLGGKGLIAFDAEADIVFDLITNPTFHPNTLAFTALDAAGEPLFSQRWCSIGGGFIVLEGQNELPVEVNAKAVPYPYQSAAELLAIGQASGLAIAEIVRANEEALRPAVEVAAYLTAIAEVMFACVDRGLNAEGVLPGGLQVKRRAAAIFRKLKQQHSENDFAAHQVMDVISVFAIAVNEENAAGGRVVTAPTNGAAGVIPAVLRYYRDFWPGADEAGIARFLLTASAIGVLFKLNASISGAEVGCQGEVGVAASMAAAGLCAAWGGTNALIENAAEIAMEHHLGMTCDPIGGLVQIPCIERNAFGAVKAVNAASMALKGDGTHKVSLDQVIAAMRQTGADMHHKYKETSQGGLAVAFVEC